ncbi:MAG: hypothetical protein D6694_04655 [Gammaproteobacteria bacterium]|nr:MAG: hypothetical protein D6694_04655 [Gammaproteobacteria bacterium]
MRESKICELLLENFGIDANPDDFLKDQLIDLYLEQQARHFAEAEAESDADTDESGAEDAVEAIGHAHGDEARETEHVTIVIAKEKDESPFVDVGVNGYAYRIRRGVEVQVPREVYGVLKNAKYTFFEHDPETGENVPVEEPRFNIDVR